MENTKRIRYRWTGIRPQIQANVASCDPENPLNKRMAEILAKGNKKITDEDRKELEALEYVSHWYWDEDPTYENGEIKVKTGIGPYVPSLNIERTIVEGGKKSRKGVALTSSCWLTEEKIPLIVPDGYDYEPDPLKLLHNEDFRLRSCCRVPPRTGARVWKVKPMIPTGWALEFTVEYDYSVLNVKDINRAMVDAGVLIGLNGWRPRFGKFIPENLGNV